MYRWPIKIVSRADAGGEPEWEPCALELSPRAAQFTLDSLTQGGHPTHLALIDAYLHGAVPHRPVDASLGHDSRSLLVELVAPMVLAYERGLEVLTLADLVLLPPITGWFHGQVGGVILSPSADTMPVVFVNWFPHASLPTETGTGSPSDGWLDVAVKVPQSGSVRARHDKAPPPAALEARAAWNRVRPIQLVRQHRPESTGKRPIGGLPPGMLLPLRCLALARAARHTLLIDRAVRALIDALKVGAESDEAGPPRALLGLAFGALSVAATSGVPVGDVIAGVIGKIAAIGTDMSERGGAQPPPVLTALADAVQRHPHPSEQDLPPFASPDSVGPALLELFEVGRDALTKTTHDGLSIDVALTAEADGGATLALLPPVEDQPPLDLVERMETAAREVLVGLMGMPFAEERKEAIEHRLIGPERTTTLLVGWSLVLPRNRRVFAAWLGSDGRVLIRLFPPEGQRARGRR